MNSKSKSNAYRRRHDASTRPEVRHSRILWEYTEMNGAGTKTRAMELRDHKYERA